MKIISLKSTRLTTSTPTLCRATAASHNGRTPMIIKILIIIIVVVVTIVIIVIVIVIIVIVVIIMILRLRYAGPPQPPATAHYHLIGSMCLIMST